MAFSPQTISRQPACISQDEVWIPNLANLKEKKEISLFYELRFKNSKAKNDESPIKICEKIP